MTGDFGKGLNTYMWSLLVLSDSTVVSGDNRGHVQFWDSENGVLIVKFHQHTSEVLALTVSEDESQVFASGTDNRVTCIQRYVDRSVTHIAAPTDSTWTYNSSHRPHTHDVFALAVVNLPTATGAPVGGPSPALQRAASLRSGTVLISGGLDCKLCVYSTHEFARTRPTFVLPVPARRLVCASSSGSVVAMMHRNHIDVWQVNVMAVNKKVPSNDVLVEDSNASKDTKKSKKGAKKQAVATEECVVVPSVLTTPLPSASGCSLDLRIETCRDVDHVHCVALSPNGKLLAVSKPTGFAVYMVGESSSGGTPMKKLSLPEELLDAFVHAVSFSADNRCLAAALSTGDIFIVDIVVSVSSESLVNRYVLDHSYSIRMHQREQHEAKGTSSQNTLESLCHVTSSLSFSVDGCYLAISDARRSVYVYELDTMRLHWRLPDSSSDNVCVAFNPYNAHQLAVVLANQSFVLYDVENTKIHSWSIANSSSLANVFNQVNGPFEGISFSPSQEIYLHGQGFVAHVHLLKFNSVTSQLAPKIINSTSGSVTHDIAASEAIKITAASEDVVAATDTESIVSSTNARDRDRRQFDWAASHNSKKRKKIVEAASKSETNLASSVIELYRSIVYCGHHGGSLVS